MLSLHLWAEDATQKPRSAQEIVQLVQKYCGACHAPPPPELMPKRSWPYVIEEMASLAQKQFETPFISKEHIKDITAFYYGTAPEALPRLPNSHVLSDKLVFGAGVIGRRSTMPLIVNIHPVELLDDSAHEFLICDGETDEVSLLTIGKKSWNEKVLAKVGLPSHTEVIDFDGDGDKDILVASLGVMFPQTGQYAGKLFLLKQTAEGEFTTHILLDKVGRVSDARALDIDNDGDLDIAVAVFGGDVNGALGWLENHKGKFIKRSLLEKGGALNISPVDLNQDGKIDFISYLSQEHEMVVAFINRGKGEFEQIELWKATHPMVGVTSVQLVDMDKDRDIDILFSNGDANDYQYDPKPYHGVQWLENKGNYQFEYHDIGRFYGAAIARAGDLDGDGDLDVVASSWNNYWEDPQRKSLIWYENDGKQNFQRRDILNRPKNIAALALSDITGDGRLDIITSVFEIDVLRKTFEVQRSNDKAAGENAAMLPRILVLTNKRP